MSLASAIEKLEKRIKIKEDRQEEESLHEGDRDDQFREELEDAVREIKRFTRSDEYSDALTLLKTIEDYNELEGNNIGEEIANKLSEKANKLEGRVEEVTKQARIEEQKTNEFDEVRVQAEIDPIWEKIWSLQKQSGRAKEIRHRIEICSKEGSACNKISYYLTSDGFVTGEGSKKARVEEIVKHFSRPDWSSEERCPSELLPMLKERINQITELLGLL